MPLRLTLKPYERLIINGTSIRNGSRNADFLIEGQCKFLRESEIIHESEADTACKKLCVTLQVIYLSDDPTEVINLLFAQAVEILKAASSMAPYLLAIQQEIEAQRYHYAIKRGRELIAYERTLLDRLPQATDAA